MRHVVYVIDGELLIDLADGREFAFPAGSGSAVSDHGDQPHRIRSEKGGQVFIVD